MTYEDLPRASETSPLDRVLHLDASPWRRWLSLPLASAAWSAFAITALTVPAMSQTARFPPEWPPVVVDVEPPPVPPPPPPIEEAPVANLPSMPFAGTPAGPGGAHGDKPVAPASAVVTAPETPANAPDDDAIVEGEAEEFAGGVSGSEAAGVGEGPGGFGGNGGGQVAPPPPPPPPPEPDRSRPARCPLMDWGCESPHPGKAAVTDVRLKIAPTGKVEAVEVYGADDDAFRRESVACSERQHCAPARDRAGHPIGGWTTPIRIRFTY